MPLQIPINSKKAVCLMPANEILQEAKKLRKVSNNLRIMAEQHVPMSEGLTILSGNVSNSATLLEVLVQIKLNSSSDPDLAIN